MKDALKLIFALVFTVFMFVMQKMDEDSLNASLEQIPEPSESASSVHP